MPRAVRKRVMNKDTLILNTQNTAHAELVCTSCTSLTRLIEALFLEPPNTDATPSRVVKKGSVVSILRVLTKRGGDDEKTADVSSAIR